MHPNQMHTVSDWWFCPNAFGEYSLTIYAFGFPVCIKSICIWEFRIAQMHFLGSVSAMTPICTREICYWQYAFGNCSVDQMHMGCVLARIHICIWEISYWQYAFRHQFHEHNNMHLVILAKLYAFGINKENKMCALKTIRMMLVITSQSNIRRVGKIPAG